MRKVDISSGTGVVFVRTSDLFNIPADLVDLAPTPAPVVVERPVYVVNQPAPAVATPEPYTMASEPHPTILTPR